MEKISYNSGANGNVSVSAIYEALHRQTAAIFATLEVQREILQTLQGMHIGDDTIGDAAARYAQKMAVVNGGQE